MKPVPRLAARTSRWRARLSQALHRLFELRVFLAPF
jgi:hypothetical protein